MIPTPIPPGFLPADIPDIDHPSLRRTVRVARRADPLDRLNLTDAQFTAATRLRRAWEHVQAGVSLNPVSGGGVWVKAAGGASYGPEKALAAAIRWRTGCQAIGEPDASDIVVWAICLGLPLWRWERQAGLGHHGTDRLRAALDRLADAPGFG